MRPRLCAILAAACMLASGGVHAICQDPPSLVAERECLARELDQAERMLTRYLEAARVRTRQGWGEPLDLAPAQAAWDAYRRRHCADVYGQWTGATHAERASTTCEIALLRQRSHDLWAAYLTYVDRTPPVLPELPLTP